MVDIAPIDQPNEITIATRYLWYSVGVSAFNIILDLLELFIDGSGEIPVIPFLAIGILSWLTYNISRGRNWARIAFVVFFVLASPVLFLLHLTVIGVVPCVAMLGLQILALYFVFTGAGANWFRRAKNTIGVRMSRTEKVLTTLGVIVAVVFVAGASMGLTKRVKARQLVELSRQLNAKLPRMIDEETRFDKTTVGGGGLQSTYTLTKHAASEVDQAGFAERVRPKLVNTFCKSIFRKSDVPVSYAYFGSDGGHIATIVVSPQQCAQPEKAR